MEYKVIEGGGITSPKGFTAGAVYVGVKSRKTQKPDVAVLYSETEASCAAVFTTNKFCAAPVILDREILKNGKARAIVINSGNANAATGTQGIEDARTVEREAEKLLGVPRTRSSSAPPALSARSCPSRRSSTASVRSSPPSSTRPTAPTRPMPS